MKSPAVFAALLFASLSCATGRASQDIAPAPESRLSATQAIGATGPSAVIAAPSTAIAESCPATDKSVSQNKASKSRWVWIALAVVAVAVIVYFVASNDDGGGYGVAGFTPAATRHSLSSLGRGPPVCPSQ